MLDDQGPPPTYSEKRKENLSTEEKSDRNERRSLVGSCTTVQFPSLSLPPPLLSLSLAERRRSFLTASSFGQDWIFWSHPHLWFADLRGVFAAAALAVVRASISGLEAALETSRQLTDRRDRYKAVVTVKLMFLHTLHKAHELSMLQEEELGEEMCCTNHHGDCDFEFLHYLYLGCP